MLPHICALHFTKHIDGYLFKFLKLLKMFCWEAYEKETFQKKIIYITNIFKLL